MLKQFHVMEILAEASPLDWECSHYILLMVNGHRLGRPNLQVTKSVLVKVSGPWELCWSIHPSSDWVGRQAAVFWVAGTLPVL